MCKFRALSDDVGAGDEPLLKSCRRSSAFLRIWVMCRVAPIGKPGRDGWMAPLAPKSTEAMARCGVRMPVCPAIYSSPPGVDRADADQVPDGRRRTAALRADGRWLATAWTLRCVRVNALGLPYVMGQVALWPPALRRGHGNVPTSLRLGEARHERPLSVKAVTMS